MATTMAPAASRRVFGEIASSRLSNLSARKNTQNAVTDSILTSAVKQPVTLTPSTKRSWTPSALDDNSDSENIDPSLFSAKRSKGSDGAPKNPGGSIFNLSVEPSCRPSTPSLTTSISSSSLGASSAPAGRSPKHKRIGLLRKRSSLTPSKSLRSVPAPAFTAATSFSIDAALSGTLSRPGQPKSSLAPVSSSFKPMPKTWFFAIHEDTPDEEAANIMEHETCTLDISSDDERILGRRASEERGKENVPPADFVAAQSLSTAARCAGKDAMCDDEHRAPLGEMKAKDFFAPGLDEYSVEIVREDDEEEQTPALEASKSQAPEESVPAEEKVDTFTQSAPQFVIAEDADAESVKA